MKTMALLLIGAVALFGAPPAACARAVDEADVQSAVETWVREVTAAARPDAVIERMEPRMTGGRVIGYVAHLAGGGYCLTGADDLVLPVYFYCPRGICDASDPNLDVVFDEIAVRTLEFGETVDKQDLAAEQTVAFQRRATLWRDLASGIAPQPAEVSKTGAPPRMDLPVTWQWGQDSPCNAYTPVLPIPGNPTHTLVGCVATSLAQIMRYWKWPTTGVGSHSNDYTYRWRTTWDEEPLAVDPTIPPQYSGRLDWTSANGGRLRMNGTWDDSVYNAARGISQDASFQSALAALWGRMTVVTSTHSENFGARTYDWSIMPDRCATPPGTGDLEVAKLSMDLGIAFDMGWGQWFSGSDLWYAEAPFENYFRYDPDAVYEVADVDIMTQEIQWMRPFAFGGSDGSSGHAWVIYGYDMGTDPNRQFHMNMGWNGNSDGWYSLDSVPSNLTACCRRHLTHIAPQGPVRFVGGGVSGDGSPGDPYRDVDQALQSAPDNSLLVFEAGSTNTFSAGSLVIDRPLTLTGCQATVQ